MPKKIKVSLQEVQIQSFVTQLQNQEQKANGGVVCTAPDCTYPRSVVICESDCICFITHTC